MWAKDEGGRGNLINRAIATSQKDYTEIDSYRGEFFDGDGSFAFFISLQLLLLTDFLIDVNFPGIIIKVD